ncbi:MAG: VRR-NUC domain-containing protein [Pseudomonadota bacterium]
MVNVLDNPFYYLDNFQRVLDWIATRYDDLLVDEERRFIATFGDVPRPARALFVRMVMRKGTLFRASKLNYAEIGCTLDAAQQLLPTGWIVNDPELSLDALFELLSKPELATVFGLSQHQKGARKAEQLAALRADFTDQRHFSSWFRDAPDALFEIVVKPLCDRLRLIFFGNLRQDWTEFVLSELGTYRYEAVDFSPSSRGFRQRSDVEHYLELHRCRERVDAGEAPAGVLRDLPAAKNDNAWLASRRERLLFQIGQQFEKRQAWSEAHQVYARCTLPGARARAIRMLEKDARFDAALALLELAQAAPENEAESMQLQRMAPRLLRRSGRASRPAAPQPPQHRFELVLPLPQHDWWVEGVVRDHLARADAPVHYVENALINGLFGLLCWDAVFAAVPGAFFHPFHHGPADLHSADFVVRRAGAFGRRLAELDSDTYRATILHNFHAKWGVQSPFLAWDALGEALVGQALDCIPAAHLKKWFERILQDIKGNRSGFPDLIQFWPAERRYQMIEVKGPGDRLQDSQLRWIAFCAEQGMPVSVCYLQWETAPA